MDRRARKSQAPRLTPGAEGFHIGGEDSPVLEAEDDMVTDLPPQPMDQVQAPVVDRDTSRSRTPVRGLAEEAPGRLQMEPTTGIELASMQAALGTDEMVVGGVGLVDSPVRDRSPSSIVGEIRALRCQQEAVHCRALASVLLKLTCKDQRYTTQEFFH